MEFGATVKQWPDDVICRRTSGRIVQRLVGYYQLRRETHRVPPHGRSPRWKKKKKRDRILSLTNFKFSLRKLNINDKFYFFWLHEKIKCVFIIGGVTFCNRTKY